MMLSVSAQEQSYRTERWLCSADPSTVLWVLCSVRSDVPECFQNTVYHSQRTPEDTCTWRGRAAGPSGEYFSQTQVKKAEGPTRLDAAPRWCSWRSGGRNWVCRHPSGCRSHQTVPQSQEDTHSETEVDKKTESNTDILSPSEHYLHYNHRRDTSQTNGS